MGLGSAPVSTPSLPLGAVELQMWARAVSGFWSSDSASALSTEPSLQPVFPSQCWFKSGEGELWNMLAKFCENFTVLLGWGEMRRGVRSGSRIGPSPWSQSSPWWQSLSPVQGSTWPRECHGIVPHSGLSHPRKAYHAIQKAKWVMGGDIFWLSVASSPNVVSFPLSPMKESIWGVPAWSAAGCQHWSILLRNADSWLTQRVSFWGETDR